VGGALAEEIRERRPDVELWGIGSRNLRAAGTDLLYDSAEWSGIGIVQSLKIYPRLRFTAYPHVLREIERRKPAAVILIDFGAFNVKVARWCTAHGFPVMWYFPPGSWKRRGRLKEEIARITKRVVTPFPWSAERLRALGADAEFVGHPLLDIVKPLLTKRQFAERFGMDPSAPIVGLLPGSRQFEVDCNTPAMLGAARLIHRAMPDAQFVFGAASAKAREGIESAVEDDLERHARELKAQQEQRARGEEDRAESRPLRTPLRMVTPEGVTVDASDFKARLAQRRLALERAGGGATPPLVIAEDLTWDVMAHSDALIVCSGTATLEAALLGTPMVIIYRGTKMMEIEAKVLRINPEHIGLPNIIADRRIMPEMIQDAASPEAISEQVLLLLGDVETRSQAREALASVRATLEPPAGAPRPSARAAEIALELAGSMPSAS
jgi:lipid-A-disaccharide synthase